MSPRVLRWSWECWSLWGGPEVSRCLLRQTLQRYEHLQTLQRYEHLQCLLGKVLHWMLCRSRKTLCFAKTVPLRAPCAGRDSYLPKAEALCTPLPLYGEVYEQGAGRSFVLLIATSTCTPWGVGRGCFPPRAKPLCTLWSPKEYVDMVQEEAMCHQRQHLCDHRVQEKIVSLRTESLCTLGHPKVYGKGLKMSKLS